MNKGYIIVLMVTLTSIVSCKEESKKENIVKEAITQKIVEGKEFSKAETIINESIKAHGGILYDDAFYGFNFRKNQYTFNNIGGYCYIKNNTNELGLSVEDKLENGVFTRKINSEVVPLTKKEIAKYSRSLNSVIYFATLPYKLQDKAVFKNYIGETTIKSGEYDIVEVTFSEKGGGNDFDDEFYYWVNKQGGTIDYLAYKYETNNGGVRFRSAYNRRNVDGIVFQDYVNWEAPVGTSLNDLPSLYEKSKLKELSRIETENITNLK